MCLHLPYRQDTTYPYIKSRDDIHARFYLVTTNLLNTVILSITIRLYPNL